MDQPKTIDSVTTLFRDIPSYSIEKIPHIQALSVDFLTDDLELAFQIREQCAWKDSIPFRVFRDYILPYSIYEEPLVQWRSIFHQKYAPLIEGVDSPKQAFDIVYAHIKENFTLGEVKFPLTKDPLMIDRLQKGLCHERSLYITAVMRSLHIPVAYDFSTTWANYGRDVFGHAWVAYVGKNAREIYTMFDFNDTVSYKTGYIPGSTFLRTVDFDDTATDYHIENQKKIAKVWRHTYAGSKEPDAFVQAEDVSSLYGFQGELFVVREGKKAEDLVLCVFETGGGWIPVEQMPAVKRKKTVFTCLGQDITYLPAVRQFGELTPVSNPVTVYGKGGQIIRDPDYERTETVILRRKYPLMSLWAPLRWQDCIGLSFHASNDRFLHHDTIHLVSRMPLGITYTEVNPDTVYRYVRMRQRRGKRESFTEMAFYGTDEQGEEVELTGEIIYWGMDSTQAARYFDGDFYAGGLSKDHFAWVGLDLGEGNTRQITKIMYCPRNDGNMIIPGDEYELFFYDMGWHSLGKQVAHKEWLNFGEVPANAVLWLRNLSAGHEERIFTYENGKQKFW